MQSRNIRPLTTYFGRSHRSLLQLTVTARGKGFGFPKISPFTREGMQSLKELIKFLETQVEEPEESTETEQEE